MIIKAEGVGNPVCVTDITFLCKDYSMCNILLSYGQKAFHIDSDEVHGVFVIAGWISEYYVLIGEFSEDQIHYTKSRCRPKIKPEVMVDVGIRGESLASKSMIDMMDSSFSFGRTKDLLIIEDELTNFTPSQMDFILGRKRIVGTNILKPVQRDTDKDKRRMMNHSYKAVRERNKFFR